MKKSIGFVLALIAVICLAVVFRDKSQSQQDSDKSRPIAKEQYADKERHLKQIWAVCLQSIDEKDFATTRKHLDELYSIIYEDNFYENDLDQNITNLMCLSASSFLTAMEDVGGNDDNLVKRSLELAKKAFNLNKESARKFVKDYNNANFALWIQLHVDKYLYNE